MEVQASTVTWINSKYHDTGSHWGIFAGIVIFIAVLELMGLGVETWYKSKLTKFLKEEELEENE